MIDNLGVNIKISEVLREKYKNEENYKKAIFIVLMKKLNKK